MNIESIASQFEVFIASQDPDLAARTKVSLSRIGFRASHFSDFESYLESLQRTPPHIVVFDSLSMLASFSDALEKSLQVSQEIYFIPIVSSDRVVPLQKYRQFNVISVLDRKLEFLETHVAMAVMNAAELMVRTFQNEQLLNSLQSEKAKSLTIIRERENELASVRPKPYQSRITDYKLAESKEELLNIFYRHTPDQTWIYLKFIDSIQTFMGISSHLAPESWVEGLSFKVPRGQNEFLKTITRGELPQPFFNYLTEKFDTARIKVLPILLREKIDGLLVTTQEIPIEVAEDFSLFSVVYALIHFESMPKYLDVEDKLTGLYNDLFYRRLLEKEVDRSKRTFAPVSVIRVGIDRFKEIEVSLGKSSCDELLQKLAQLLQKTSRLPDFICRIGESEFAIILTNCNRKGAAVRAERLRLAINKESFVHSGIRVTVSQGISEYPSLTNSADELDDTAAKSLEFIATKGGDKLCIYKAPDDHQPDFSVND